jgi:hypothetical protein
VRAALPMTRVEEEVGAIYRTMLLAFAGSRSWRPPSCS